jgi:hypothetical protein
LTSTPVVGSKLEKSAWSAPVSRVSFKSTSCPGRQSSNAISHAQHLRAIECAGGVRMRAPGNPGVTPGNPCAVLDARRIPSPRSRTTCRGKLF